MSIYLGEEDLPYEDSIDILMHYGTKRHSGRYPWGSGKDPYQHTRDLLARVELLKKKGWTETPDNIYKEFGLTTTQYRAQKGLATKLRRMEDVYAAKSMKGDGLGATEIARKLSEQTGRHISESTVRSLLNSESEEKMLQVKHTADFIRKKINEKGIIDITSGVEYELNVSREKLNQAVEILTSEGYKVFTGGMPQATNEGQQTNTKVIGPKDMKPSDFYKFKNGELNINSLTEYITRDGGETYEKKFHYPESMDPKRLKVVYAEEGGVEKDGLIELRPNTADLDLGNKRYAQVRIMVDGTHYLKGMACYGKPEDFPEGVDAIFNTNKHVGTPVLGEDKNNTVLKKIKSDPDNPFGSLIKDSEQGGQYWYTDKDGERKLGLVNKARDEGDWTEWKDKVPAQFLSKQSLQLAKQQLSLATEDKKQEFDEIMSINNPVIKKYYLNKFAEECDSAAVHLQAAALPGQKYHVILPNPTLKDNEVYAPGYENGQKLALVRYPHEGTFEIPILTVNNRNKEGQRMIGKDSIDAICINKKNADKLSGADFDGDTVMCIPTHDPNGRVRISAKETLEGLEGFDSKQYKIPSGDTTTKRMKDTQKEMGVISNLITDMTLLGATDAELARATRHAMVVIDAEKHDLDYKRSEKDNEIQQLKDIYQNGGGASTLISRSKSQVQIDKRQGQARINIKGTDYYDPSKPEGALLYKPADDLHYTYSKTNKRTGEVTEVVGTRHQKSVWMKEATDANELLSTRRTPMERAYADYANDMKGLANKARVEMVKTPKMAFNRDAKKEYAPEVESLMNKLRTAEMNKPKEREAQRIAISRSTNKFNLVKEKIKAENPGLTDKEITKRARKELDLKKTKQQELTKARQEVGSVSRKDRNIKVTDREWEAIQKGAVTENVLSRILNNADADDLRSKATPKQQKTISSSKRGKVESMKNSNYTIDEICKATGLTKSQVYSILKE